MPFGVWSLGRAAAFGLTASLGVCWTSAFATPWLVADADTGQVLIENEATAVWYPASLTKLMTVYVALDAVRAGKLTMDTPLVVSIRASRAPPSKMGFRPGTEVTLDNALKMLMVKSPNDLAVTVAEGISGSVESFADAMNAAGQRLGLHESHFVNPNGLHNPDHVSSARDMAIIARALLREFPDHADLFGIGALQLGNQIITNHNGLIGRYPGADGMKTGFTCPAGFNVVASASHYGRHLLVVVLGSPSARFRTQEAADLFDRGFAMGGGSGSLDALPPSGSGVAPNMRADVCLHRSAALIAAAEEESMAAEPAHVAQAGRGALVVTASASGGEPTHTEITDERPRFDPVPVFVGPAPGWKGPVLAARPGGSTDAALPAEAKAYVGEKTDAEDGASASGEATTAPAVLKRAVRTPHLAHGPKAVRKPVQNAMREAKPPGKAAGAKAAAVPGGKDLKVEKAKVLKTDVKPAAAD
jgi:D-alanyl-D-alanine carboxypeptidase